MPSTKAGAILIEKKFSEYIPKGVEPLFTDEPYLKLAILSKYFAKPLIRDKDISISNTAQIEKNVVIGGGSSIGDNTLIMSGAVIGSDVKIGKNCIIYPNVVIYNDTIIGDNVTIHAGSVIGSDGFGYAHTKTGEHIKIYHLGYVKIEDDVEIGANTTIDRGAFGETIIKKGAKIDNLVQIGHNCEIGEYSILVSQVGLAGSSILGDNVSIGGQAGISGHLKIGNNVKIGGASGVTRDIPDNSQVMGYPAVPLRDFVKLRRKK